MLHGFRKAAGYFIAAALFAVFLGAQPRDGWYADFSSAQQVAKSSDRPILVHFGADWCAPCKRMEREVLHNPSFLSSLNRQVVPVKVDVDEDRSLARKYGIESVPTDLFLSPDGRVLGVMNGFRTADDYLQRVAAVENQFERQKELFFALSDKGASLKATGSDTGPRFPTLEAPESDPGRAVRSETAPAGQNERPTGPKLRPRVDGTVLLGLKGYCPVSLYRDRKWVKGDPKYKWEHQGLTYFLATSEDWERFRMEAERYAPRLLGCDPVLYFDEGKAIPGSTSFAVYFDEVLYLFKTPETRARFRETPERYIRRQTVLLIDEMEAALR